MYTDFMNVNIDDVVNHNYDMHIEFNFKPFKAMDFFDAAKYTTEKVANEWDNLHLAISGGIDSEFILNTFYENKIDVQPIMFVSPLLRLEVQYAIHFCKKINKEIKIHKVSIEDHLKIILNGIHKSPKGKGVYGFMPHFLRQEYDVPLLDGTGIPVSTQLLYDHDHSEIFKHKWPSSTFTFGEWAFYNNITPANNPGSFWLYTQEMLYAFITTYDYSLPVTDAKAKLFNLPFRPKIAHSREIENFFKKLHYYSRDENFTIEKDELLSKMKPFVMNE